MLPAPAAVTGRGAHAIEERRDERLHLRRLVVRVAARHVDLRGEHVVGGVAGIDVREPGEARASSIAATRSRTANADSMTRRPSRSRRARTPLNPPAVAPSPPCSDSARLKRAPRSAGASPESTAVTSVAAAVNAMARASMRTPSSRGKSWAATAGAMATRADASPSPRRPPSDDKTALSVKSCRASRARLAPIAARTVSSRCLATPLESDRLATFAHAMSRTQATATASTTSAGLTLDVLSSTTPRTCTTGGPPMPKSRFAAIGRTSSAPPPSLQPPPARS
jgi:hypothetical protein